MKKMFKMKKVKKVAVTLAVMAALMNNGNVNAAEKPSAETEIQAFEETRAEKSDTLSKEVKLLEKRVEELSKSKKSGTKKEIEEINEQIAELNRQLNEQKATQEKIVELVDRLEKKESQRQEDTLVMGTYSSSSYLVNPSGSRRVNYTQDAANSQGNSTMTFRYAPNQLYKIYCRVGYLTDLSLKKGETISFVGGGDTSAWAVEKAVVDGVPHIYIKPTVETSTTNLIITTNKRSYQLILNTSNWYNPMVTWTYQQEEATEAQQQKEIEEETIIGKINGDIESLNFDYKISGESRYKPEMVFDDGEKTIIKFSKLPKRLPSLFIKEKGKKGVSMANYKIHDNYYIMDRIANEIELRIAEDEIIKIKHRK